VTLLVVGIDHDLDDLSIVHLNRTNRVCAPLGC
jgi:hypothetical protein